MKDSRNFVDRFCNNHRNFGIPNLMKYIAIANLVFLVMGFINPVFMNYMLFSPYHILHGQVWRLISFMFYPPGSGILALVAIYFYYWIGKTLEAYWGAGKFTFYIISGYLFTVVYAFLIYFIFGISIVLTAEYIYLAMFFAFATLFPDMQVLLFFVIPVKMKYLAWIDLAFFAYSVITGPFPVNLLPVVALANYALFFGGELIRKERRKYNPTVINFKREAQKIRREQAAALYNHKCAVCGRNDTDYPTLDFRYCSRCAGYHCFCEDHINSHIHFTE